MKVNEIVEIVSETGDSINIPLDEEGDRKSAVLLIGGIRYHFERVTRKQLVSEYRVDDDPEYQPQTDAKGCCYILAPFSE